MLSVNKLSVYLDQNALSTLASDTAWAKTKLGQALLSSSIDVFVSPVHVLETMQAEDAVRTTLAKAMLELCGARRMCPSYEFIVAESFFKALENADAHALRTREHLCYHKDSNTRIYLGALAILAQGLPASPSAVDDVRRSKLINQVLHVRAAAAPREWLTNLLDCTSKMLVTSDNPLALLDAATNEELRAAVAANSADPAGLDADVRRKLQKHRAAIAAAYGAVEIGACLEAALPLSGEVEAAFDAMGLVGALRAMSVSQELPPAGGPAPDIRVLVRRAIYVCAKKGLPPASISNEVVLREIENAATAKETPNAGVVFDADHAVYLCHMNIFVTDDEGLLNTLRPIAKRASSTDRPVEVCASDGFTALAEKLRHRARP
jgi:hypothetical protein